MSAIAGFRSRRAGADAIATCGRMLHVLRRYGPNPPGLWSEDDIALGGSHYSGRDTAPESPLAASGRFVLAADVRLDNREEIGARLRLGSDLAYLTDERLLLVALERLGTAALDLILGDYAFALFDRDARRLVLARDPLGQRPLFYSDQPGYFAFASMPSGLHAIEGMMRSPDANRLAEFVGLLPLEGSGSFYRDICRVQPGHMVTIDEIGIRERRYWTPQRRELRLGSPDAYREAFRAELDRAVASRMRGSGAVVATHLSSGWDSGAVTATVARLGAASGVRTVAFTAVPRQGASADAPFKRIGDEGDLAGEVARMHPGIEHVRIAGAPVSPVAALDQYYDNYQRPLATLCNQLWLTAIREDARRRGAHVLLTGEFGNWTISSSPPTLLADLLRERRWATWWREARAARSKRGARWRGVAAASFAPWLPDAVWRSARRFSSRPEASVYTAVHPSLSAQLDARREFMGVGLAKRPKDHFAERIRRICQHDFGEWRKGTLGGWRIEERDPTADRRLIEFCLSLPLDALLKDGARRPLARAALADRLPPAVLDERRKGYQAADWHEGMTAHHGEIRSLIERIAQHDVASAIVDVAALRQMHERWPAGGWDDPEVMARYRVALLVALSAGHFAIRASE